MLQWGHYFMEYLWETIFYNPVLNALIALYNGPAGQNLGIALIELTVILRVLLFPLTILSIRARNRYDRLRHEVHDLEVTHKDDPVQRKEGLRMLLKLHRISPWAKASVLGIQFLVLIVLYRVFTTSVRTSDFSGLYDWNTLPDFLNTTFLGFDLIAHSAFWAGIVAVLLYLDLWISQRRHKDTLTNSDVFYRVAFPLATFAVLYILPMGKSVFVLTSILFTLIVEVIRKIFFRPKQPQTVMGLEIIERE